MGTTQSFARFARFDDFWQAYPRKAAKGAAKTAWVKAVKQAEPADIIAGAERYRDDPNRADEFTAYPATWLNAERWSDEPLPPKRANGSSPAQDALDEWMRGRE